MLTPRKKRDYFISLPPTYKGRVRYVALSSYLF